MDESISETILSSCCLTVCVHSENKESRFVSSSRRDSDTKNQSELMIYLHKNKRLTTEVVQRKAGTGSGVSGVIQSSVFLGQNETK